MGLAANGETMNAKLEPGRDFGQRGLGALAPVRLSADEADVVAAVDLSIGEVQDVTEDSTDRRAHRVQDTKRLIETMGMIRTSVRRPARYRRGQARCRAAPRPGMGPNGRLWVRSRGRGVRAAKIRRQWPQHFQRSCWAHRDIAGGLRLRRRIKNGR